MPHSKSGCKNKKKIIEMNNVKIERTQWVKDLGVAIAFNLKLSQQCKNTTGKTYRMLGFINRNSSFINKDIPT